MTRHQVALIGGTFDPIHIGHLVIAERAREQLGLDEVIFLPAGVPPHKQHQQHTAPEHRLAMTRLATADNPGFSVSERDIRAEAPSYTVDLLRELASDRQGTRLTFIIGGDSLRDFPTWHDPAGILELARLAVADRPDADVPDAVYQEVPGLRDAVVRIESPLLDISATDLRQRVARGQSIRYLVPDSVADYIASHGLYTTRA